MRRAGTVAVAAVLGVALTASLGFWQLRRASQKTAMQTALDSRALLPVLGAADLVTAAPAAPAAAVGDGGPPALHYRRVRLQGQWVGGRTVFLENRQMNARVGFYVVTPLQLAGRPQAVLVQRGWVPRDVRDRSLLPTVPTPEGQVELTGVIAPPPGRLYEFAPSASGVIRQNIDLPAFATETGLQLLSLSVQQTGRTLGVTRAANTDNDGLKREWPRPAVNVEMHNGYAFQWFALSALMAGLYAWFQLLRPWLGRRARR